MRYPNFISEGSDIGFVAPSFGCTFDPYKSAFENALKFFREKGFGTIVADNCYKSDGIGISTTPRSAGEELTEYYVSARTSALISCGGGELMCTILPYVDFDAVRNAEPKWFMGYSDNTNFTFLLSTLCDTASIYGPCAPSFGMSVVHRSLTDALSVLEGKRSEIRGYDMWERESLKTAELPLTPYNLTEKTEYIISGGNDTAEFSGRLLGGCLDCLSVLCGTAFDKVTDFNRKYGKDGIVWFLESCDLNVMGVRRVLWQLKNAGWFDCASGFIIGRPYMYNDSFGEYTMRDAVTDTLSDINVPVVMDADIGHLPPMMPVICGSTAEIRADRSSVKINYTFE